MKNRELFKLKVTFKDTRQPEIVSGVGKIKPNKCGTLSLIVYKYAPQLRSYVKEIKMYPFYSGISEVEYECMLFDLSKPKQPLAKQLHALNHM